MAATPLCRQGLAPLSRPSACLVSPQPPIRVIRLAVHAGRRSHTLKQQPRAAWRQKRVAVTAASGPTPEQRSARTGSLLPGQIDFPAGTVLGKQYEVQELLGRGGNGVTYRCRDTSTGKDVAVKCLSLRSLKDWKQLDLFEREAQTLKGLDHRGIPRYLATFEQDTEQDRGFFLVQELAQGQSLSEMVRSGWRADEAEVTRIATELLGILEYLGSRRPPVTHRDVKPENIVIEGGKTGGRVFLVDFGGVQAAASSPEDALGSTIVGTYGYMAPEQFRGAASPASDLYGLGGTLLLMLSGRPPSAFPIDRMKIDISSVKMGARLEMVVEGLLEPLPEDRMPAEDALAVLKGQPRPARSGRQQGQSAADGYDALDSAVYRGCPAGSKIQVKKRGPRLEIDIPPSGFSSDSVATGAFAIAWNSFVVFWTVTAVAGGGLLFGLFSLPFWAAGWQLAKQAFGRQFIRERLVLNLNSWKVEQQMAFLRKGGAEWSDDGRQTKEVSGRTMDLQGAKLEVPMVVNGQPQYQLVLEEGINRHVFGEGLNPREQEWLAELINAHLDENRGRTRELGGFVAGGAERALPPGSSTSGAGGPRYGDWAADAEAAARQAQMAGQRAAQQARRMGDRAIADGQRQVDDARRLTEDARKFTEEAGRRVGSFGGSSWGGRGGQQQRKQNKGWSSDDEDDDMFRL